MLFTLIIKGNSTEALAACENHNVSVIRVHHDGEIRSTLICDADNDSLGRWFCEPTSEGAFPVGTLLHYGQDKE